MFSAKLSPSFSLNTLFSFQEQASERSPISEEPLSATLKKYTSGLPESIKQEVAERTLTIRQRLASAAIQLETESSFLWKTHAKVVLHRFERKAAVVTYKVTLGRFSTLVTMLNVDYRARRSNKKLISEGRNKEILGASIGGKHCIHKRFFFSSKQSILTTASDRISWEIDANFQEIRGVVVECAWTKLCSALGVGPQLVGGFDLVCFANAIQFTMEKCQPVSVREEQDLQLFRTRMMYCLGVMHSFGLIHKDIKPQNIMYSPTLKEYVFIDFGVSQTVREKPGNRTLTCRQGTYEFMSPAMKQIPMGSRGKVDLFWNDLFALEKSCEVLSQTTYEEGELLQQASNDMEADYEGTLHQYLWELYQGVDSEFPETFTKERRGSLSIHGFEEQSDGNDCERASLNPQFLIRSMGLSLNLIPQIEKQAQGITKLTALLSKLRSEQFLVTATMTSRGVLQKWSDQQLLGTAYLRMLNRMDERLDSQDTEFFNEQASICLRIADIYFESEGGTATSMLRKALEALGRSMSPKSAGDMLSRSYICWLVETMDSIGEIPASTSQLFQQPLSKNQEKLLLRCIMMKYCKGDFKAASGLCAIQTMEAVPQSTRLSILNTLEAFSNKFQRRSEKWAVITSFVRAELYRLGENSRVIRTYSPLLAALKDCPRSLSAIMCDLGFAYNELGMTKQAMNCLSESIKIQQELPVTDRDRLAQAEDLLLKLTLNDGSGVMQEAPASQLSNNFESWGTTLATEGVSNITQQHILVKSGRCAKQQPRAPQAHNIPKILAKSKRAVNLQVFVWLLKACCTQTEKGGDNQKCKRDIFIPETWCGCQKPGTTQYHRSRSRKSRNTKSKKEKIKPISYKKPLLFNHSVKTFSQDPIPESFAIKHFFLSFYDGNCLTASITVVQFQCQGDWAFSYDTGQDRERVKQGEIT